MVKELEGIELLEFTGKFNEMLALADTMEGDEGRFWKLTALFYNEKYLETKNFIESNKTLMSDEMWKGKFFFRSSLTYYELKNWNAP